MPVLQLQCCSPILSLRINIHYLTLTLVMHELKYTHTTLIINTRNIYLNYLSSVIPIKT